MKKFVMVAVILLGNISQDTAAAENMNFKGTLREDVPCEINHGEAIDINFETIGVNKIDGERYKKTFVITVTCPAGFKVPFKILYIGQPSEFDVSVLATNIRGLGIKAQMEVKGGFTDLDIGGYIDGSVDAPQSLIVVPVKNLAGTLIPGEFNASASFRLEYY